MTTSKQPTNKYFQNIAATALFLANKTEENCRKTKDIIIAVAKVAQKNVKLIIDEQSKEYWKWRDSILAYEELMLETLTFDLVVENPYNKLHEFLGQLGLIQNKRIRDSTWAFCNDACLTVLPLMLSARDIAIAAIFFATCVTKEQIDDVNGQAWWKHLEGSERNTVEAVKIMCEFYSENPLRKPDTKVPGSPEFNLESTRRRGELSLSHLDLDSSQYASPTPVGAGSGGMQSPMPTVQVNGRTAEAQESSDSQDFGIKKEEEVSDPTATGPTNEPAPALDNSGSADREIASTETEDRGDSDAALKVAANDLATHDDRGDGFLNGGVDAGGLVSPRVPKRRSEDPESAAEDREPKRARLNEAEDEDEGEIRFSTAAAS